MNRSTSRLLSMKLRPLQTTNNNEKHDDSDVSHTNSSIPLISEAIVNEARVALHYWSRRWYMHFHPGFGRAAKGSALSWEALRNSTFHFATTATADSSRGGVVDDAIEGGDKAPLDSLRREIPQVGRTEGGMGGMNNSNNNYIKNY